MGSDKLEKFNARSLHYFVISVLRQIAANQKKDIRFDTTFPIDFIGLNSRRFDEFDAVAPNGFNDIEGLVVVEIKYNNRQVNLSALLSDIYKRIEKATVYSELTVVLITNSAFTHKNSNIDFRETSKQTNIKTEIWGEDVLQEWISAYPIDFSNAVSKYASLQVVDKITSDITNKNFDDKSENNTKNIKHIIGSEDSFALVLGAGVSVDPGAKTWNELLLNFCTKQRV